MNDHSSEVFVRGVEVDAETRCAHWHSPLDIIAIKFKCCGEWYSCYDCHREMAGHNAQRWRSYEFELRTILCGACRSKLKISDYLDCSSNCRECGAAFNPGCAKHYELYFEM